MANNGRRKVVILGAGFGGAAVAEELSKLVQPDEACDVTLVDRNNFSLFTPMLTEVAGGAVDPTNIVVALRALAPGVTFLQARVESIDAGNKTVTVSIGDGMDGVTPAKQTLQADHLVIALGSVTNFHHVSGLEGNSLTIKSVEDAEAIRNRAVLLMERANAEVDAKRRRAMLTFVVGGGGFSGVETIAAVNDFVRDLVPKYPHLDPRDIRMLVVQPGGRLLPELSEGLAQYTLKKLEERGVEVMLNTEVSGAGAGYVEVKSQGGTGDTQRIDTHTLVWAGGVKPSPVIESAGLKLGHHHGIVVDECCAVPSHPGIWALGDCAEVPQQGGGTYAPTAQNAIREGPQVARNIVAQMKGQQPQPFIYHPIGELAIIGKRIGVASVYGMHFSGIVAWAMWRAIYLAKMPDMMKRIRIALDWVMDSTFGRELAALPGVSEENGQGSE